MKKLMLLFLPLLFVSCSNDEPITQSTMEDQIIGKWNLSFVRAESQLNLTTSEKEGNFSSIHNGENLNLKVIFNEDYTVSFEGSYLLKLVEFTHSDNLTLNDIDIDSEITLEGIPSSESIYKWKYKNDKLCFFGANDESFEFDLSDSTSDKLVLKNTIIINEPNEDGNLSGKVSAHFELIKQL